MDKYLRTDEDNEILISQETIKIPQQKSYLIKKKKNSDTENEYRRYMKKNYDEEDSQDEENLENEDNKFLMKDDDKFNENFNQNTDQTTNYNKNDPLRSIRNMQINLHDHLSIQELNDTPLNKDNLFSVISKEENNQNKNYLDFENIYLNEGKIKKNMFTDNLDNDENLMNKEEITSHNKNKTILIPTLASGDINITSGNEMFNKNEFKLRCLQDKIEDKLRNEYDYKIKQKEKELEIKTYNEIQAAMHKMKSDLEKKTEDEKIKLHEKSQVELQEKYEEILIDCKSKLRDDKEKKLAMNMYHKLKPSVEKEIYKNEYNNLEQKIRKELESKLKDEVEKNKLEEIERIKKKLENFTKNKIKEIEGNIKTQCKEEIENEIKKELERKEKEIKINYLRKFETLKNNLEKQLREEYVLKEKELSKEVSEMKSRVFRQKCAEKVKLKNINNFKKNLEQKEKVHFENAEKLEKAIIHNNNNEFLQNSDQKNFNSKSFFSDKNSKGNLGNEIYLEDDSLDVDKARENKLNTENNNYQSNYNYINSNNAVNLMELNRRLKTHTPLAVNSSEIISPQDNKREVSLIIKQEQNGNNKNNQMIKSTQLEDNFNNFNTTNFKNENLLSKIQSDSSRILQVESPKKSTEINQSKSFLRSPNKNEDFSKSKDKIYISNDKENPIVLNCLSLRLNSNIPVTLNEFGKFLVKYIENEENYKILFEKEYKKLKIKIRKIFENDNTSDHCLLEYMIELWEKIEISYSNRYRILVELPKR